MINSSHKMQIKRHYRLIDKICIEMGQCLQVLCSEVKSRRTYPAEGLSSAEMGGAEQRHVAGLMRINHTGEVCAQALYRGQMAVAKKPNTYKMLEKACLEEVDHLSWTADRLHELDARQSLFNVGWYVHSFTFGVLSGLMGDRWSLGYVEETERQVCEHLNSHLDSMPVGDQRSRAIVLQMREDEAQHGAAAHDHGGISLPRGMRFFMRCQAKMMTTVTYYL